MKRTSRFPFMLLAAAALLLAASQQKANAGKHSLNPVADTPCLVKSETAYDFADSLRKKVYALIEDRIAGGIEEKGTVTWENSPDAPEYYHITLRRNKLSIRYKGTVCQDADKLIAQHIDSCRADLKKLLNK
ncbi:hypothetical protein ECE50_024840 [Chitinophaga sp. Mgbs1]|uniref:DUF3568 family protein n=1 Tax=Chitinophaga solisilvae TaxID=1233460 RepID=A0A9Q5DCR7_9BACT|nr:hypothetical protein [Chitinophaga solisilvae]